MSICQKCGASLADSQAFCSSCGTHRDPVREGSVKYCSACGRPIPSGSKFCTSCGVSVGVSPAPATAPSPMAVSTATAPAPQPAVPQSPPRKSGFVKVIFGVIASFLLVAVLGMGSCVYLAYRAKLKIHKVEQAYKENDLNKVSQELGLGNAGGEKAPSRDSTTAPAPTPVSLPTWSAYTGSPSDSGTPLIPLKNGLITVSSSYQASIGDYETIVNVSALTPEGFRLQYTYLGPAASSQPGSKAPGPTVRNFVTQRTVRAQDLASAHELHIYYSHQDADVYPGTTSLMVSREVFRELKTRGESEFHYQVFHLPTTQEGITTALQKLTEGGDILTPGALQNAAMTRIDCKLRRAASSDIAVPLLLNDKPVEVPAIHAVCKSDLDELHLYILDEEEAPMPLFGSSQLGHMRGQLIRISFPEVKSVNAVERDLKETGRAKIYGIYFDFNSASIRPQSTPVLEEIAKAMKDNPGWKLSVEGHTDSIGGDASNQELSKRRAAAVVQALTTQYGISTGRFTTAGFGASRPVDTNETLEGRARNRRVELVRQ